MGKKNILLFDSQAGSFHEPLEEILSLTIQEKDKDLDFQLFSTKEPRKALEILENKDIDLAILELNISVCGEYDAKRMLEEIKSCLPDIDEDHIGYRFLKHIKNMDPAKKVIILASYGLCGESPEDEKAKAIRKGAHGFMLKPFGMKELADEILKIM